MRQPTRDEAIRHAARTDIVWYRRFELAPGVFTDGTNDFEFLDSEGGFPTSSSARVTDGVPEYLRVSYERPLRVTS